MQGVCRGIHAWTTLSGTKSLGAGTHQRLYIIQNGLAYDVTPIVQMTTPSNPFTTTLGSSTVTVLDAALTVVPTIGDFVEISGTTEVGGLTLSGEYTVSSSISSTSYTLTANSNATSSATGGGTSTLAYLLPIGASDSTQNNGWGLGAWGAGTWSTPRSISDDVTPPRTWTIDNFGEQMIACPRGGGIYVWLPSNGTGSRAAALTGAPTQCNGIFVSNAAEQIIALGCIPASGSVFDPMWVAWCDNGDYTTWVAASGNAAGGYPLTDGSQIMGGCRSAQQNLIWTDTALYGMQYIGGTLIYGFTQLGTGCGLISPAAFGVVGSIAAWMSGLNFITYNGSVQVLDCPVRDAVYRNMNTAQSGKIVCGVNSQFSEIRWDYPSLNSTENDSYVIWNYAENTWTLGGSSTSSIFNGNAIASNISISRTAWEDYTVWGNPIAFDANGNSWSHESGYSAGGYAMPWFLESGQIDIANGSEIIFCDQLIPDQILSGGSMAIWVQAQRFPNDSYIVQQNEPFQIVSSTKFVPLRLRGRQMSVRFDNSFNSIGGFWRLGALRARFAPDGRN